jgi:trk system potassium uptake protein TrkH
VQVRAIQRILGLLLMVFSTSMVPPLFVSWWFHDAHDHAFSAAFILTLLTGLALWLPVRGLRRELRLRDGFAIVVMFWTVLGLFGALPFAFLKDPSMTISDSVFESISGLTTTGATVITGIDRLPQSVLWYRQQLQWLGGMGIIVLAVAIMPMLGVGGMQLYRAETPGPMKENKLTPRITETAKALWYIYLGLTVACAAAYWLAGMGLFDAVGHAFSTISIGGFSTHDQNMGFFRDQPVIEMIAIVFMLISGANFALHFVAWRRFSLKPYLADAEFRTYVGVLGLVALITTAFLYGEHTFASFPRAALNGVFQAVSIGTTAGFTTSEYHTWPGFLPVLLLFTSFIGGCAGSTGGGLKVLRFLLLLKQGLREIARLIHPSALIPIKVGDKTLPDRVVDAVWGFFAAYVAVFSVMLLVLMATGLDQVTAFSAVAACMNNLGPGLGEVGPNYGTVSEGAKWVLCLAMLLGRLEIFSILVLFTPTFWRR